MCVMKMHKYLLSFIALFFSSYSLSGDIDSENNICDESDTVFVFMNGVRTIEEVAGEYLEYLDEVYGKTDSKGNVIQYELLYNQTNGLDDLVEVFEQRVLEQHIALANRYELFFQALEGNGNWLDKIRDSFVAVDSIIKTYKDTLRAEAAASLTYWRNNPATIHDYNEHRSRIDNWILEGKKLLFIAHSQGNLFANEAYRYATTKTSSNSIKLVHVAPASVLTYGPHVLADQDLVINGLRALGTVPENTDYIPIYNPLGNNYGRDFLGHGFVTTYLNEELILRSKIFSHIDAALNSLESPEALATSGFFTVTLTWDGLGDVDLHVYEPSGQKVYFGAKAGRAGYLDYDNMDGFGPEHYYASCDKTKLQTGTYQIKLANFMWADDRVATVQVASNAQGVLGTRWVRLGYATGWTSAYHLFNVEVVQDEVTGKYTAFIE